MLRESEKPGAMFLFEQAEPRKAKTARAVPGAISVRKLTQDESLPLFCLEQNRGTFGCYAVSLPLRFFLPKIRLSVVVRSDTSFSENLKPPEIKSLGVYNSF